LCVLKKRFSIVQLSFTVGAYLGKRKGALLIFEYAAHRGLSLGWGGQAGQVGITETTLSTTNYTSGPRAPGPASRRPAPQTPFSLVTSALSWRRLGLSRRAPLWWAGRGSTAAPRWAGVYVPRWVSSRSGGATRTTRARSAGRKTGRSRPPSPAWPRAHRRRAAPPGCW